MARLAIKTGKDAGREIELERAVIIGRGEGVQLRISDTKASREHCRVFLQGDAWVVADLNSSNGLTVNDIKTTRRNLKHGDAIQIGKTVIVFQGGGGRRAGAPSAAASAPAKSGKSGTSGKSGGKPDAADEARRKKEAAFAAARASAGGGGGGGGGRRAPAQTAGDGSIKVSDKVLQFSNVDRKNASAFDIDLDQMPATKKLLIVLGTLAFLGGCLFLVFKMFGETVGT